MVAETPIRAIVVGAIELVETLSDQAGSKKAEPWHVRLVDAGNHAKVYWTEQYSTEHSAADAITWLGRLISPAGRATTFLPDDSGTDTGWLYIWLDEHEFGEKLALPIRRRFVPRADA